MATMRLARLVPLLLAATGCVTGSTYYTPPRAAPPLTEQQAVDVAADYARSRGLEVERTTLARLDGSSHWLVELSGPVDQAEVLVDAVTGRVVQATLRRGPAKTAAPPQAPGRTPPAAPVPAQDDWEE